MTYHMVVKFDGKNFNEQHPDHLHKQFEKSLQLVLII